MAPHGVREEEVEEDDYLTMSLPDPSLPLPGSKSHRHETLTQRKRRLAHEAEARAHPKSKAELAREAKQRRREWLRRNLLVSNNGGGVEGDVVASKGAAIMAKLGYKAGTALGKAVTTEDGETVDTRLLEPLGIPEKEGRGGVGADAEKKRKIREEVASREDGEKRRRIDAEEYRVRQAREREDQRTEGQLWGAMKVADLLDAEDGNGDEDGVGEMVGRDVAGEEVEVRRKVKKRRLGDVNVLWRGLVKQREVQERDRRMRYDLHQSLSTRADYIDPEEDREGKMAFGRKEMEEVDGELDCEDEELEEFAALEVGEKLDRLVKYLRERWRYCFWCKFRYPDASMEGCPGLTEDDHS